MKENKPKGILVVHHRRRHLQGSQVRGGRRPGRRVLPNEGYVRARVGQPELKVLENTKDGKTRWIAAAHSGHRGPALPGRRASTFDGNTRRQERGAAAALQDEAGEWYSREGSRRRPARRRRRSTAAAATWSSPAFPDLKPSDDPGAEDQLAALVPDALRAPPEPRPAPRPRRRRSTSRCGSRKGQQYFVNRITFTGNTTTRDNVIRREMRLVEGGVFNTEALKYSVRRLNQLGYFKQLEGNEQGHEGREDRRPRRTPWTSR